MLGRVTMNASDAKSPIHDAMDAALNRRGGAAEKIMRAAMMTRAAAYGDLKSLIENLVDVRETRKEMQSREDADQQVMKRLEFLEESLEKQSKELNRKFDRVIDIFERKPDDVIRRAVLGQRTFKDARGRELTQNSVTGRFERPSGNRNTGTDKQDGLDVLRGILDYQKKIHNQNERSGKHVEKGALLNERTYRLYQRTRPYSFDGDSRINAGRTSAADRRRTRMPTFPMGPMLNRPSNSNNSGGGFGIKDLINMVPGGQYITGGVGGLLGTTALSFAKKAVPFAARSLPALVRSAGPAGAMLGLAEMAQSRNILKAPDFSKGVLNSIMGLLDPNLAARTTEQPDPAGAPNRSGSSGPNANLFKNLPEMIIPRANPSLSTNILAPEDTVQIQALQEAKEQLIKRIDEARRGKARRNFRDYRVDEAQRQIDGIDNQISSIRSGSVAGGTGRGAGAGGSTGPYIPGVTPGLGQTPAQAQDDARQRLEQAKMPAYNPQFSPGTAAGSGPMQLPGASPAPFGVTGLPITFGGGGGSFEKSGDWSRGGKGTDQLSARGAAVVDHYAKQGIPEHVGAAIAGNINTESKFNTHSSNTSGEDSHGMFQWNDANGGDRWKKAQAWAAANGRDISDPKTQLDYAKVEASQMKMNDGSGRSVWDAMMQSKSAKEASDIWLNNFEKPKERVQNSIERGNNAAEAYDAYKSGKYSSGPAITASVPDKMQMPAAPRTSMADIGPGTAGDPKQAQFATVNPTTGTPGTGSTIDPSNFDKIKGTANLARNGDPNYYGDPSSPSFRKDNLTTVTLDSGKTVQVNKVAAESYRGFLNELEASGYKIDSLGGFAPRANVNDPSKASMHSMGTAIDINPAQNPNQPGQTGPGITNLPSNISDMAAKYGISWGGDWKSLKDTMHFEYAGQIADNLKKAGVPAAAAEAIAGMPNAPSIPSGIAPAAPAAQASIFSGQAAPPDLKSRTLGAMVKAAMDPNGTPAATPASTLSGKPPIADLPGTDALVYRGGMQEAKTDDLVNRDTVVGANKTDGLVEVKTIGPNGTVIASTPTAKPAQPAFSDWLNQGDDNAGSRALKSKIEAADADAKAFADDFDRRFNGTAASAQKPPEMSTPSRSYERQPTPTVTPTPAAPAPSAAAEPKPNDAKNSDNSDGPDDAASGNKKMSEIEMQINDFGMLPLNSTDRA